MRERKIYNKCYENFADFATAIRHFFCDEIAQIADLLKKRITDNFQCVQLNSVIFPFA